MDYGLDVLLYQEETDELKPIELKIDKGGLTEDQVRELECVLNAHMDLFVKQVGILETPT